jgi:HD domain-containing protein
MLQYADHAGLLTSLPTIDEVLDRHASELGHDLTAYRNHVYRVVNLCVAILGDTHLELEKVVIAAVFHDLGIWTNKTFDYIAPSVALAREYLAARGMTDWIPDIEAMIADHHKVTSSRADPQPSTIARGALSGVEGQPLVESFRRADWIDVTWGFRRFSLPRPFIAAVAATWPDAGFHRRLVELAIDRWWKHPLNPLPMVKW